VERLTPHLGAAADELENAKIFSRGDVGKKFLQRKNASKTLTLDTKNFSARDLEIKTGFSKSVRRQVPNPGPVAGLPRSSSIHVALRRIWPCRPRTETTLT
jgi:hypothetical protein